MYVARVALLALQPRLAADPDLALVMPGATISPFTYEPIFLFSDAGSYHSFLLWGDLCEEMIVNRQK